MASFYGGSPGLSMMIVKSYLTKENMINDFKQPNCSVGIGECVCIDSGMNDGEHGNIYRRAVNSEEYEYVGNMAGPMGPGISFAAIVKVDETSATSISDQINTALGINTNNPITDAQKLRSILCEDKQGLRWIYSYNYKNDGSWVRVGSYDKYVISNTKPNNLSAGGLWLCTQEVSDSGKVLNLS
jgi:hypothetical protein